VKYTAFYSDVLPHLKADPSEPVLDNALRNTAIEFFRESWSWRVYTDPISVEAGVPEYDVELPTGTDIVTVLSVTLNGAPINPNTNDELDRLRPRWTSDTGLPKWYTMTESTSIVLAPVPDQNFTDGLVMHLALMPTRSATSITDWAANLYWDGIVAGTIAYLMEMPEKPWSNEKFAANRRRVFNSAVASARESAVRGLSRAPLRTVPQN
jgi:hypothetical protein